MAILFDFTQYFETTLSKSGGLTDAETSGIVLNSISGVDDYTRPGSVCLTFADPLVDDSYEWITYTSINNSTLELNGVVRGAYGSTARSHLNGCRVAFTLSKGALKGLRDRLEEHDTGWTPANETWTYSSVDGVTGVITVPTDATTKYSVGMRVKFTQTTVKYGIITAIAATTMTIYTGTDYTLTNAAITSNYYSAQYAPLGFPTSPAKWTVTATDTSSRTQGSPVANTWYNLGSVTISVPIGVWNTSYSVIAFVQNTGAATDHSIKTTLSTANNSESDSTTTVWHAWRFGSAAQFLTLHMSKSTLITVAAKTSYYLNTTTGDVETTLGNSNNNSALVIKAVCAYL